MKQWKKPIITELKAAQLAEHIHVSAGSDICLWRFFR